MAQPPNIDGILITWNDRLFYPSNRVIRVKPQPRLSGEAARQRAAAIRKRIEATVVRRAPQVMVKVTGGGRGMKAIAAHFRYIRKDGRLEIEDQRGETMRGKDTLHDLAEEWHFGGSLIPDDAEPGHRREAFNIMLSIPRGTDPLAVQRAAREFAQAELADHKYVMVLHDHQANPHVQHQRACGVGAWPALEPSQDRPASVARNLCGPASRTGSRCRGDPPSDARRGAAPSRALAGQGARRRAAVEAPCDPKAERIHTGQSRGRTAGLARAGEGARGQRERSRPAARPFGRGLCLGHD
jgi:hypothetical protein